MVRKPVGGQGRPRHHPRVDEVAQPDQAVDHGGRLQAGLGRGRGVLEVATATAGGHRRAGGNDPRRRRHQHPGQLGALPALAPVDHAGHDPLAGQGAAHEHDRLVGPPGQPLTPGHQPFHVQDQVDVGRLGRRRGVGSGGGVGAVGEGSAGARGHDLGA